MSANWQALSVSPFKQIAAIIVLLLICSFSLPIDLFASPTLNFSDITLGPKVGNTDGVGSGAIVTIWGNDLGAGQGSSKVYVGKVEATTVYYWKNADGFLPGGPADLSTYHKMQEIAFAIPKGAIDGVNTIKVVVGVTGSNTLPFTVRTGNIYFVKPTGNDSSGNGSWTSPWSTLQSVALGDNGKVVAGDIIYSVGVGASNDVNIGKNTRMPGTLDAPYTMAVYPNTVSNINSSTDSGFRNYYSGSHYWNFSKFTVVTTERAFSIFQGARIIGNKVSGPNEVGSTNAGWIGGGCDGTVSNSCGGHKIFGNEVFNYGKSDGSTSIQQHLYYISNRSGSPAPAYEIGWNYHHDNPIWQGIHVYDQSPCGGWTGILKIHDNVVKNQGGNSININLNCSSDATQFAIYNNIIVKDVGYVSSGTGAPAAAIRVQANSTTSVKLYNNTIYGYAAANTLGTGTSEFRNNIIYGTQNVPYFDSSVPASSSNNLFFNSANPSLPLPSWATGSWNVDPLLAQPGNKDFTPKPVSPIKNAGSDIVLPVAPNDFVGKNRTAGTVSIGAIDYNASPRNLKGYTKTP